MKFLILSALAAAAIAAPATVSAPPAEVTKGLDLAVWTVMRVVDGQTRFHSELLPFPTGTPVPSSLSLVPSVSSVPPAETGLPLPSFVSSVPTHTTFVDSRHPTPFVYAVHGNVTRVLEAPTTSV